MSEVQEINVGGSVFDVKDKSAMTLALNNKVGAKNFIAYPYRASTTTVFGVTFTVNSDGTVGVNGTATALTGIALMYNKTIKAGKYILSSGIANENVWVRIYKNESPYTEYAKTGLSEVEFEFNEDMDEMIIAIGVDDGYIASNIVVKPMLRLADDPNDTYEPYAMTNRELTTSVVELQAAFFNGAVNISSYTTMDNMFTCPCDGYIYMSAMAHSNNFIRVGVYDSASHIITCVSSGVTAENSLFVRKGMCLRVLSSYGADNVIMFEKIKVFNL